SVVALFERGGRSALLTGDASGPAEAELLAAGGPGFVDVLKVGHHGSRTSTTPAFVASLRPRVAMISCGRRNRFGHPAPETLASLSRMPIICGGRGFYIAALLGILTPGEARDPTLRSLLTQWGKVRGEQAAHRMLALNDPVAAARIPARNLRYTLRALEILLAT